MARTSQRFIFAEDFSVLTKVGPGQTPKQPELTSGQIITAELGGFKVPPPPTVPPGFSFTVPPGTVPPAFPGGFPAFLGGSFGGMRGRAGRRRDVTEDILTREMKLDYRNLLGKKRRRKK
jgi:hypothetical protein